MSGEGGGANSSNGNGQSRVPTAGDPASGNDGGGDGGVDPSALASCPTPVLQHDRVVLGHGSGGKMSDELVRSLFLPAFEDPMLASLEDQATVSPEQGKRIALTTDSFVVQPRFFPGGDIGKLAVHGTINDLAVGGADPRFLAAAFILEEGLAMDELQRVIASMRDACREIGVRLVTGDTKVVDRGKGDGLYVTTTGVGFVPAGRTPSVTSATPGDCVIVSGSLGDHGMAIVVEREGIELETSIESDTAPLSGLVQSMYEASSHVHCMRDPTRGGLSSAVNEIARASEVGIELSESDIPVRPQVKAACEVLGLDPLYVANEGKLVAIVPEEDCGPVIDAMRAHPLGRDAAMIGRVVEDHAGVVTLRSRIGGERVVTMLSGEQLPRIC